jgi:ATP-binding cassette subfamily F protein uup
MNYLNIENLTLHYGDKVLFDNISLYINQGDKIALVAKNGSGKTTLFKLLFGEELPNQEAKFFIHNDVKVGYLKQEPDLDESKTIREVLFSQNTELFNTIELYQKALVDPDKYPLEQVLSDMDRLKAWDVESRVSQILGKLEIYNLDQKVGTLSGGQKKRVALTALLIEEPQLILLDEPTNHLDPDMIEWLEGYLSGNDLTLFIVTHDRYFLDNVCNRIIELDNGKLQKYQGDYAYYIEKKQEMIEVHNVNADKARNLYRKELEWMRRQPKARSTKAKSRIDHFEVVKEAAKNKIVEDQVKLETIENRLGSKILEFRNAGKSFGDKKILDKFDYKFRRNEKVGIVGKNGVGKSTFLNMILGYEKPDTGDIVVGDTVKIGYYRQENSLFPPDKRLIEVLKDVAEYIPLKGGKTFTASQMLERFMFPSHQHYTLVNKLSGGEKRRLALLMVLMGNPNFLILDEPTNDLDIVTLNVLQDFIEEFEGCVLLVTHDRFFMDSIVEHLFIFEGNGVIKDFNGSYTEYRLQKKSELNQSNSSKVEAPKKDIAPEPSKAKRNISFKEKHEFEKLEKEMEQLEEQKKLLTEKLYEPLPFDEMKKISDELEKLVLTLDQKTERWLELGELM